MKTQSPDRSQFQSALRNDPDWHVHCTTEEIELVTEYLSGATVPEMANERRSLQATIANDLSAILSRIKARGSFGESGRCARHSFTHGAGYRSALALYA